jgi:hypothetical protein
MLTATDGDAKRNVTKIIISMGYWEQLCLLLLPISYGHGLINIQVSLELSRFFNYLLTYNHH